MLLPLSFIAEECKGRMKVKVELIRSVLLHRLGQSVNADSDLIDQEWELSFDISSKLPSDAAAADPWPTLWVTITSFYTDFLSKLGGWAGLSQNLVDNMMKGTGSITHSFRLIFKMKLPSDLRRAKHMKMNHLDVVSSSLPHSYPGTLVKAFPLQTLSQLVPEPVLMKVYRRQQGWPRSDTRIPELDLCPQTGGASQMALVVKNMPTKAGDVRDAGSTPGSERSPEGGHGNPLQDFCLKNPLDKEAGGI